MKKEGGWQKGREGRESETWQMNSYTYQDKHASIHVANAYNTFKYKDVMRLNV